ncbi:hypothetical protein, conserved [Eimeria tenella]|uniref:Uncharacterized protein n=1 Tax=Eimeria tenella TaxID=5802 RepID=U6KKG8_EIMTE|nr:hypothetical protein, conserved [Eimeria tenella]CDJ37316.1 hypothetical protein, conserved [Eimeria tenella]|eukprot:XP_013228154.1 hypothetical protein, conserved [Eimeria tenella]
MRSLGGGRRALLQQQQQQPQQQQQQPLQQQQQRARGAAAVLRLLSCCSRAACSSFGAFFLLLSSSLLLLLLACIVAPLGCLGFPMDAARNAELQQQRQQEQEQQQQQQREEAALALLSLHEKYSPPNCKYHPLPSSLDSFGLLNNNGELTVSDVFGLPGTSEREEFLISFTIPAAAQDGHSVLSLSADLHRDSFVEFKYLEVYRHPKQDPPMVPFKHALETPAAAEKHRRAALQSAR